MTMALARLRPPFRLAPGALAAALLATALLAPPASLAEAVPAGPAALPTRAGPLAQSLAAHGEPNLLLLEVRLDGSLLADAMTAYEVGDDLLLPLGELARLLTLGVAVDARARTASGFVVREERAFRLSTEPPVVRLPDGGSETLDPAALRWEDNDLFVPARALQRWWPLDLEVQMSSLTLTVKPREKLPIQARLERERAARGLGRRGGSDETDPGYPRAPTDYRMLSVPFVDQTLGLQFNRAADGSTTRQAAWSAYLTGDLAGMEAALYVGRNNDDRRAQPEPRLTLSRNDPDAGLLGPLGARSLSLGNVGVPAVPNVLGGGGNGTGLVISNRPLNQPSSYGLETLRGDLPPGWDVTLYFNDALVGFQTSGPQGQYEFADLPLVFGANEFRLVFNGPLGQSRVERRFLMLDQNLGTPGELLYTTGVRRGDDGSRREMLQADYGLTEGLAVTAGLASLQPPTRRVTTGAGTRTGGGEAVQRFTNVGLRAAGLGALWSLDHVIAERGGSLSELALRTRLGRFSVDLTHTGLSNGFVSDFYRPSADPLRQRTRLRLGGSVPLGPSLPLPLSLDLLRESTVAGNQRLSAQGRLSVNWSGTSLSNTLTWRDSGGTRSAGGALQVSRRVAGVGLNGQLAYVLHPQSELASLAVAMDKNLSETTRLSLGLLRRMDNDQTVLTGSLNRNFGSFGLGLSARYGSNKDLAVGLQLFTSFGRDPRRGRWTSDWQPMAGSGVVSARVFLDDNLNGEYDDNEELIEGAGFLLNTGSRHPVRTDAQGLAYLSRLAPRTHHDIALDPATLEDPQWQAFTPGVRVLARPGKVHQLDFAVVMTGEIDGNVFLLEDGKTRGIGNAEVELVAPDNRVVVTARSGPDGYYILPAVLPGRYQVRVQPAQLERLGLRSTSPMDVVMGNDGEFIDGMDFVLRRTP